MKKLFIQLMLPFVLVLSLLTTACGSKVEDGALLSAGAVASPDKFGAKTAEEILKKGGNAVDAAVATAFSLAVTYPEAGNIGGGGLMTLYVDGKNYFLDYREMAPGKATKNMFLDKSGEVIPKMTTYSYKAVAVPATVAGMWAAHKKFGKLTWQEVLAPAIKYAVDGFEVDKELVERYQSVVDLVPANSNFQEYFGGMKAGEIFKQPELAKVLELIADKGPDGFYKGEVADLIAKTMTENDGLITTSDLAKYKVKWREPAVGTWKGMQVVTSSPPSSGGIGLIQLLKMKEMISNNFDGVKPGTAKYIHLLAELEKRIYADRSEYLGDPDFVKVPMAALLDEKYLMKRAQEINVNTISPTANIKPGLTGEKMQTTHFSIVDKWGNAVSNTYTLNGWFGTGIVVKGTGIVLNNEMDDFSAKAGVANQFGVIGNDANAIAPYKRPLSSMSPTLLTKDGKVCMVIGTPGGSRIITTVFQVLANVYDNNMNLKDAIEAPRYHHQLFPQDKIFVEKNKQDQSVNDALIAMGYTIDPFQLISGNIEAIQIDGTEVNPVSDTRDRGLSIVVK